MRPYFSHSVVWALALATLAAAQQMPTVYMDAMRKVGAKPVRDWDRD